MRILFINDRPYLPQVTGGLQWNTHELCMALGRRDIKSAVLCEVTPVGNVGLTNRIKRRLKVFGDTPSDNIMGYTCFRGWDPIKAVVNIAKKWRPDVVIVQGSHPEYGLLTLNMNIPSFYYFHFEDYTLSSIANWRELSGYFACSEFIARSMGIRYDLPIMILPPLVSVCRATTKMMPKNVLSFGLLQEKGADFVMDLAELLPDIPFRIIETWQGDRERNAMLRERGRNISNLEICGPVDDVRLYLSTAKVLIVPSRCQEGWGRVVTEAQINGIPVISSGTGGLPEAVGNGGVNIPLEGGLESWAFEIRRLFQNSDYFNAAHSSAITSAQRYSLLEKNIIDKLLSTLVDV